MKLINAKEALLFELGDFGVAEDAKPQKAEDEVSEMESGTFEVDENGNLVGWEKVDMEDEEEGDEEVPGAPNLFDALGMAGGTQAGGDGENVDGEPKFENEEFEGVELPTKPDEQSACMEAATEAMMDRRMPDETFNWGLDYINKLGKAMVADLKARWAAIDKDEMKRQIEEMEAAEQQVEESAKEQYLRG